MFQKHLLPYFQKKERLIVSKLISHSTKVNAKIIRTQRKIFPGAFFHFGATGIDSNPSTLQLSEKEYKLKISCHCYFLPYKDKL
jgi:hypothetical protein